MDRQSTVTRAGSTASSSVFATNKVLRNTYWLLSLTLLFSAVTAAVSMAVNPVFMMNPLIFIVGYFALFFLVMATRNSHFGIVSAFLLTGFLGFTLGPILNAYIATFSNGPQLIMMALGGTGLIFVGLSALSLNPARNYTGLGSFIMVGVIMAFIASLLNVFWLHLPMLQLAISVVFALISGAYIMFQTSLIVRGGETNYIMAAVGIYVSIFNLFLSLLQLLSFFAGNRN